MPITQSDLVYHQFYSSFNHHQHIANTNINNSFVNLQVPCHDQFAYQQHHHQRKLRYRAENMAQMSAAELENFQDLSDHYHAELPGPLISDKLQMDVLVREYSQADPTYIRKTTGLAATHSGYRAVKGDGQCGWRSTVFRYFELLLENGDAEFIQHERIRLESFKDTMLMVELDYDILQDMFDPTWELFQAIQQAVQTGVRDATVVLNAMNDQTKSDFIVYHFKSMTSAFMRLRSDDYSPFLEMTVDEYCMTRIDPAQQEIDQIGLQALTDAVISQAGFGLEVLYLDRSSGDEVTPHSFTQSMEALPVIRLLYRPGHYDIIYKGVEPIRVYLQSQQAVPQQIDMNTFETSQDSMSFLFPPDQQTGSDFEWTPHDCNMPQHYNYQPYQTHQYFPQYEVQHPPPPIEIPKQSRSQKSPRSNARTSITSIPSSRSMTLSPSPINSEPQIRFHPSMTKMGRFSGVPISATASSSTVHSTSHFKSTSFQPHQYNPGDDYNTRG